MIYFGGLDVLGGRMTTGELLQFVTYTQLFIYVPKLMTNMPRELMNLISSMERINDVLTQEPFIEDVQKADSPLMWKEKSGLSMPRLVTNRISGFWKI